MMDGESDLMLFDRYPTPETFRRMIEAAEVALLPFHAASLVQTCAVPDRALRLVLINDAALALLAGRNADLICTLAPAYVGTEPLWERKRA